MLTATPPAISELAPQPCDRRGEIEISVTNSGDDPGFVDVLFEAPAGLRLSREAWSTWVPADPSQSVSTAVRVSAARDTEPGSYRVTATVGDEVLTIPVTVTAPPGNGPQDNLALYRQAIASSTHVNVTLCGGVDGNTDSELWGLSGTHDATPDEFPDSYGVILDDELPVGRVEVHTLDSAAHPAAAMGIRDFDVQARVAGQWRTVTTVRGNQVGHLRLTFAPVEADRVQLVIHDSNDHHYSRIVELEIYQH